MDDTTPCPIPMIEDTFQRASSPGSIKTKPSKPHLQSIFQTVDTFLQSNRYLTPNLAFTSAVISTELLPT